MDLTTPRVFRWDDLPQEAVTQQLSRKIVTGAEVMAGHIWLAEGTVVPLHSHAAEQYTCIFSGALKFIIAGQTIVVRPGDVLVIPSWVEHEAVALEPTYEMDVFTPIRTDWLDKTDSYFTQAPTQAASFTNPATADNPARVVRWDDLPVEAMTPMIDRSYLSGVRASLARFVMRRDAVVPTHQHESEQLSWVRAGCLRFEVAGQRFEVPAGSVLRIPANLPHSAVAVEPSEVMDLFSPRRDDWINQQDQYLRSGSR